MTEKPYYHERTDEELERLRVEVPIKTWGEVVAYFKQPDWCNYPDALMGPMGCWSLVDKDLRKQISLDYCKGCDCAAHYDPKFDKCLEANDIPTPAARAGEENQ